MRRKICALLLPVLLLACASAEAQGTRRELIISLDESLLQRFEALAGQLPGQIQADPALKADFKSVEKDQAPKGGAPATVDGLSKLMASRHPRLTAALAADDWKPGEFYTVLGTLIGAEASLGNSRTKKPELSKGSTKNVAFVQAHKARVDAALERLNKGMGTE